MTSRWRGVSISVCVVFLSLLAVAGPFVLSGQAQDGTSGAAYFDLINEERLAEGLDPFSQSRLLSAAAQRHADDIAENGFSNPEDVHRGSDGSGYQERIEEAGYIAWEQDDEMVIAEIVWSGGESPQDGVGSLLENQDAREHLLSEAYREIGMGIAADSEGQIVLVLTFGARPNVLPIFVNDGAPSTENREVAVRLTNERVQPEGRGTTFIGEAIEIRINNEPDFEGLAWQPWAPLISWLLPDAQGDHTVYVQFRDAAGRTAATADGIFLDKGTPRASPPVPLTTTSTPSPAGTATLVGPSTVTADEGGLGTPQAGLTPSPGPSASPSAPAPPRPTPFPTWTPLPSPEPTPPQADELPGSQMSLPSLGNYREPLTTVAVLQGFAIVLGLIWLVRRGRHR